MSETQKRKIGTWKVGIGVCRVATMVEEEQREKKVIGKRMRTVGSRGDLEDLNRWFSCFDILKFNSQYITAHVLICSLFFFLTFFIRLD